MEIKNKLAVTRGGGKGIRREGRGRGKQREPNRGLMGTDNMGKVTVGVRGGDKAGEGNGEKGRTTVTEQ